MASTTTEIVLCRVIAEYQQANDQLRAQLTERDARIKELEGAASTAPRTGPPRRHGEQSVHHDA